MAEISPPELPERADTEWPLSALSEDVRSAIAQATANFTTHLERGHDCWVLTLDPSARENIPRLLATLRGESALLLDQLIDITALDSPAESPRFTLVYHLLGMHHNIRLRVKCTLEENQTAPSVTRVFPCANWYEREVWDMFGIAFSEHPDLRRILTDYGFEGHPLRKDFPLTGHLEVRYDESRKEVVYEPVALMQAYRNFDFESPWEEITRLFAKDTEDKDAEGAGTEGKDAEGAGTEGTDSEGKDIKAKPSQEKDPKTQNAPDSQNNTPQHNA